MKKQYWIALALAVIALGAVLAAAKYGPELLGNEPRKSAAMQTSSMGPEVKSGAILPLPAILEIGAKHVPGEVLKIKLENEHGRFIYEIKILAENGRVRELELDAHTGELLEIEDD